MNLLFSVTLNKRDTCLTYALKRIGQFVVSEEYSLSKWENYFNSIKIEKNTNFKKGDIILWNKKSYLKEYNICIDENGIISKMNVQRNIHVGVIEKIENELIYYSECRTDKQENTGIPVLHYKQLDLDKERLPDLILTLK